MINGLSDITQKLEKDGFPEIQAYRFFYMQMFYSTSNGALDCVKEQMRFVFSGEKPAPYQTNTGKTVHLASIGPKEKFEHPEYKMLVAAGKIKRAELERLAKEKGK